MYQLPIKPFPLSQRKKVSQIDKTHNLNIYFRGICWICMRVMYLASMFFRGYMNISGWFCVR